MIDNVPTGTLEYINFVFAVTTGFWPLTDKITF